MPSLTLPNRLIWFAHCPKAGGTTVEKFMVAHWGEAVGHLHWGWDLWWRNGGWRVANPPNSPQHLIWRDVETTLADPPDVVFAVVRDPITRMQSEQRWQRRLRRGRWLGKAVAYLPFSVWLALMLEIAARHPHAYDNHLRPQTVFVPKGARIFRLEDGLEPVLAWLAAEAGCRHDPSPVKPSNQTGHAQKIGGREAARISESFTEDYARFGYPRPKALPRHRNWIDCLAATLVPVLIWMDRRGQL